MADFEKYLTEAKANIEQAKQSILAPRETQVNSSDAITDALSMDIGDAFNAADTLGEKYVPETGIYKQPQEAPIIRTFNNGTVAQHADDSYSVISKSGEVFSKIPDGKTAIGLATLLNNDGSTSFIDQVGKVTHRGALNVAKNIAKAASGGPATLAGQITASKFESILPTSDAQFVHYPDEQKYYQILDKQKKGVELSSSDKEFIKSPVGKYLAQLEKDASVNRRRKDKIGQFFDKEMQSINVDNAPFALQENMYEYLSEQEGDIAALWDYATNYPRTMALKGAESVPFMALMGAGGKLTQAASMGVLIPAKVEELAETFRKENKREPNVNENTRLVVAAALSQVGEKLGDEALFAAFPSIAKIGKHKFFARFIKKSSPAVQKAVKPALQRALKISKATAKEVARKGAGLLGEGVSGALTETLDTYGVQGKMATVSQLTKAAIDEAESALGSIPSMTALSAPVVAGKALKEHRLNTKLDDINFAKYVNEEDLRKEYEQVSTRIENTPEEGNKLQLLQLKQSQKALAKALQRADRVKNIDTSDEQINKLQTALGKDGLARREARIKKENERIKEKQAQQEAAQKEALKQAQFAKQQQETKQQHEDTFAKATPSFQKIKEEADTAEPVEITPEHIEQLKNITKQEDMSDAEFKAALSTLILFKKQQQQLDEETKELYARARDHFKKIADQAEEKLTLQENLATERVGLPKEYTLQGSLDGETVSTDAELNKQAENLNQKATAVTLKQQENKQTLQEANKDVVSGEGSSFKHYYELIDQGIQDYLLNPEIGLAVVNKAYNQLKRFAANRQRKAEAFQKASQLAKQTGKLVSVSGIADGGIQVFDYETIEENPSDKDAIAKYKQDNPYVWIIFPDKTSDNLVQTVSAEAEVGQAALDAANAFFNSDNNPLSVKKNYEVVREILSDKPQTKSNTAKEGTPNKQDEKPTETLNITEEDLAPISEKEKAVETEEKPVKEEAKELSKKTKEKPAKKEEAIEQKNTKEEKEVTKPKDTKAETTEQKETAKQEGVKKEKAQEEKPEQDKQAKEPKKNLLPAAVENVEVESIGEETEPVSDVITETKKAVEEALATSEKPVVIKVAPFKTQRLPTKEAWKLLQTDIQQLQDVLKCMR